MDVLLHGPERERLRVRYHLIAQPFADRHVIGIRPEHLASWGIPDTPTQISAWNEFHAISHNSAMLITVRPGENSSDQTANGTQNLV